MYQYISCMENINTDFLIPDINEDDQQQVSDMTSLHPGHDYIISIGGI